MTGQNIHPLIQEYVDSVCQRIKAKQLHQDIRKELYSHFEELLESEPAQALDKQAAAEWAIRQMGEFEAVAKGLNQVHRPRVPWGILGSIALLLFIALIAMFAVDRGYQAGERFTDISFVAHQAVFIVVGTIILFLISRIHYRVLLRYSNYLYLGLILLMSVSILWGPEINGMSGYLEIGPVSLHMMEISIYLFIMIAAADLYRKHDNWKSVGLHFVMFTVVPFLFYIFAPSTSSLILYGLAYGVFLLIFKRSWRWVVPHAVTVAMLFGTTIISGQGRLAAFFYRLQDSGYIYHQIEEGIHAASWWGNDPLAIIHRLPYIHSETIFTYMIYSLGWAFGIFTLLCALFLVVQMSKAALAVRDSFGRMLISGLVCVFGIQFGWSFGMSLGILPMMSVSLPFISYGGSALLVQLASIGWIYSVYRRKDLVRPA